ncbi:polysaccharide pyruvyl transferase family protein [Dysgonomonas gadei]|uniref:Polysaccharide pyruvyl transferase domain-containing protein n=1 Tax=Dysgonomonas gadei ATCC BAA-286 TaxID=742766 RepID=F5IUQ4_9BACT|nr:polysaccharide pyruvyl transferase family protein [Dysgonomonas gadei]EGK02954.1 hypothetical protein HMPREF9455_01204 [Dysgonomonas gadei ATCC BAA-286]
MKVSLITLHRVHNFGSLLQTYATVRFLQLNNAEVEVVDYIQPRLTPKGLRQNIIVSTNNKKTNKIKAFIVICLRIIISYFNDKKVDSFLKEYIPLTKYKYHNIEDFNLNKVAADIYMTGSDQVWNTSYNAGIDPSLFLAFATEGKKKISYAASFGKSKLELEEKEIIFNYLSKYDSISVREDSGLKIIEDLGLTGTHVLDPTFLLDKEDWIDFSKNKNHNSQKEPYLLIYSVHLDSMPRIFKIAQEIAEKKNLKIYLLSYGLSFLQKADKVYNFSTITALDFIHLFNNAEFIVACSFHGAAFSINLNKQFVAIAPKKFGTRTKSILAAVGIEERYIEDSYDIHRISDLIDYNDVNLRLNELKYKSRRFLRNEILK